MHARDASADLIANQDSVSERLRRWTRNPLGSARRGSNPLAVGSVGSVFDSVRSVSRLMRLLDGLVISYFN